jgi:predicted DNA-binding protein (UPF0278 family)
MPMILVEREYVLSLPINEDGDMEHISLKAYNITEAINKFRKKYPIISRKHILNNIEDLTEIKEYSEAGI